MELFFTPRATEEEHYFISDAIETYCKEHNLTVQYYRQFKTGHQPQWRECKIVGESADIYRFKDWATEAPLHLVLRNRHAEQKAEYKEYLSKLTLEDLIEVEKIRERAREHAIQRNHSVL